MEEKGSGEQRIVVGVDGSAASVRALDWALMHAEAIGAGVEAVGVWDVPPPYGFGPTVRDDEDLAGRAEQALAPVVDAARAAHPSVTVHTLVLRGHPAAVLLEQAKDADLLVVGSRGHGGFVGALLGSVSHHCVQHAACPVVVVRATR